MKEKCPPDSIFFIQMTTVNIERMNVCIWDTFWNWYTNNTTWWGDIRAFSLDLRNVSCLWEENAVHFAVFFHHFLCSTCLCVEIKFSILLNVPRADHDHVLLVIHVRIRGLFHVNCHRVVVSSRWYHPYWRGVAQDCQTLQKIMGTKKWME